MLDAWVDFNQDGDWLDPNEQIFSSEPLAGGLNTLGFSVPIGTTPGDTFARFRLSSAGALSPDGPAGDGEVEDYRFTILDGDTPFEAVFVTPVVDVDLSITNEHVVAEQSGVNVLQIPVASLTSFSVVGTPGNDRINLTGLPETLSPIRQRR
jgi:hypothetical protein